MYNIIIRDKKIKRILKSINNSSNLVNNYACHGYGHAVRVSNYCEVILRDLGATKREIELGKIAGYLHDIACANGKKQHGELGAKMAREYLTKIGMKKEDIDIICDAIYYHSKGQQINSNISAALLLADKIDISKSRVLKISPNDPFNNVITNISKVNVHIDSSNLEILYLTSENFDAVNLRDWKKAITVPVKVAEYFDKDCSFLVNGVKEDLLSVVEGVV